MSKLYFRYGAMNCGKTSALIQVAHNYEENSKNVLIVKSTLDTKASSNISSRVGLNRKVDILLKPSEKIDLIINNYKNISCILVDEAQFLTKEQVDELWYISKLKNIPVICYGLRTDFKSELFTGSERLLAIADELEELITICSCGKRAKFNARFVDGKFTLNGSSILIDGSKNNVKYIPMCGKCFLKEIKRSDNN